jgi:REP element-mobilizing transposase RayT
MSFLSKLYFGCTVKYRAEWPGVCPGLPPPPETVAPFEADGIRILSTRFRRDRFQAVVEVEDSVAPSFLMQRLKGRLSYCLGKTHADFPRFSPHFFLRSLGQNTRDVVKQYVREQVDRSDLVDPLYRERMKKLRYMEEGEVMAEKTRHRGVYDAFAHVVLITGGRYRMFSDEARKVFDALCGGVRELKAEPLEISMMPDHAHLLLRWPQGLSAEELLQGVKRESGKVMRRSAFWNNGGYVGSVGPYPIRTALDNNAAAGGWRVPGSR